MNVEELSYVIYDKPSYIYLPIESKEKLNLKRNKIVFSGSTIGTYKGLNIFSPVSGKAIGYTKCITTAGEENCLVIENDYKDKKEILFGSKKNILDYKKMEMKSILQLFNLNKSVKSNYKFIVSIDSCSRIYNDLFLLKEHAGNILETINALLYLYGINEANIIVNNKDTLCINELNYVLGTYPNIKLITTNANSKEKQIESFVKSSQGYVVYTPYELFCCYNALRAKKYTNYTYITVNDKVVKVLIGTYVKDILSILNIDGTEISLVGNKNTITTFSKDCVVTKDLKEVILK